MGTRILLVSGELIVELAKGPGEIGRCFTVENALPKDARIVSLASWPEVGTACGIVLESSAWDGDGGVLEPCRFSVHKISLTESGVLQ